MGRIVLAGTPIGSKLDASPALVAALTSADLIAAEDTREFRALVRRLQITVTAPVVSCYDQTEAVRAAELVAAAQDGGDVVLVSDAGMPTVSDPGFRVVRAAVAAGVPVTVVPGPSAALAALAVSGLPPARFCFEGFLPRKAGARRTRIAEWRDEPRTIICFEAPHRLAEMLAQAVTELGADRPAAVCRELTKPHEEVRRGTLAELADWAAAGVRGEITVVIGPAEVSPEAQFAEALAEVQLRVAAGERMSQVVADVAQAQDVSRKQLYDAALKLR